MKLAAIVLLAASVLLPGPCRAASPQLWFAPVDWFARDPPRGPNGFIKYSDYMALFAANPPPVMSRVNVFKIFAQTLAWTSDDDLRRIIDGLRREHIALALETGVLTDSEQCGRGVEGYGGKTVPRLVQRIAALGGELAYLAMDEPAWFGHVFGGAHACRAAMTDIARDAAINIAAVRKIFPHLQVGDIEPVGPSPQDSLISGYADWADAYRQATGAPLAFFHADVQWEKAWLGPVEDAAKTMHERGIAFGIIYNGTPRAPDDKTWIGEAEAHYSEWEADGRAAPDQIVFQSWVRHPSHLLPDTDPGAFTYLIRRYFRPRTHFEARQTGNTIAGRLVEGTDKAAGQAQFEISGKADSGRGIATVAMLRGVVPAGAKTGVLGLRINTECNCSGPADVAIGTLHYREIGAGSQSPFFATGEHGWRKVPGTGQPPAAEAPKTRYEAASGQALTPGTQRFPVTAGAQFVVEVPWRVSPSSAGSGYLALMFLDAAGKELGRSRLPFESDWVPLGQATTAADGKFTVQVPRLPIDRVRLVYAGSDALRPTTETLPYAPPP